MRLIVVLHTLLFLFILLLCPQLYAAPLTVLEGEELLSTDENFSEDFDTTLFDLYIGDKLVGLVLVNFTDNWMEIEDIDGVIEQLKGEVKEPQIILPLLEGRITGERVEKGIGQIRFDPYTFHIVLNIEPPLLITSETANGVYLPDPQNDFSFQQRFGVNSSGEFGHSQDASSFNHRTMASVGRFYTNVEGTFINDDDKDKTNAVIKDPYTAEVFDNNKDDHKYDLTEAVLGATFSNYQFGLGASRTDGDIFAGSVDFLGGYVQTSEEVFLDKEKLHGSHLTVFIPSRSRVEFFQGSRLISTQILDYGLQDVDTRNFPHGSYDVDIVIHQNNGTVTRDRQFFTKSGQLTIRDHPMFALRAGVLRDNFDTYNDKGVFQASTTVRTLSFLENEASVQGVDDVTIGALGMRALIMDYNVGAKLLTSSESDHGYQADLGGNILSLDYYVSHSETSADNKAPEDNLNKKSHLQSQLDSFNALAQARATTSGTISKTLGSFIMRMRYSKNKYLGSETYAWGPDVRWDIIRSYQNLMYANVSYTKTDDKDQFFVGIFYRRQLDNSTSLPSHSVSVEMNSQSAGGSGLDVVRSAYEYNNVDSARLGTELRLQNEINNRRGRDDDVYINNEARLAYADQYLDSNSYIYNRSGAEDDNTSYGVNAESSFVLDKSLVPKVAYPFKDKSAVVIVIDSDNSEEMVDVYINGSVRTSVKAGTRTVIGLPPYSSYTVMIKPKEENEFTLYDADERRFTLFPGNIVLEEWKISKMFIGVGRLVDSKGTPIEWERILGTNSYTTTEDGGFFQAELVGDEILYLDNKKHHCTLEMPDIGDPKFSVELGDVVCK